MEYTIGDLKNGKCAIDFSVEKNLKKLRLLLKSVSGKDWAEPSGRYKYYYIKPNGNWDCTDDIELPSRPVFYFLDQLNRTEEKSLPRVMWVSDNVNFTTKQKRVVVIIKNNRYIAWGRAKTIEEAEEIDHTVTWKYAKEIEELLFPFSLTPENALLIINNIACSDWRTKLANKWGSDIVLGNNINVEEKEYLDAYNLCNGTQRESLDKIFK